MMREWPYTASSRDVLGNTCPPTLRFGNNIIPGRKQQQGLYFANTPAGSVSGYFIPRDDVVELNMFVVGWSTDFTIRKYL